MGLQALLDERNISKYRLSKMSGVPKTTIMDICAGRSEIDRCSARTVLQLAQALSCSMEDLMELSSSYDAQTGLPKDKSYLEKDLPASLTAAINAMENAWQKVDQGERYLHWDCDYCELQTDINNAEINQIISPEQAWYLREKYLRMERA